MFSASTKKSSHEVKDMLAVSHIVFAILENAYLNPFKDTSLFHVSQPPLLFNTQNTETEKSFSVTDDTATGAARVVKHRMCSELR